MKADKCHFHSNGECKLLAKTECNGYKDRRVCGFSQTTREFIERANKAIEINQHKGNCDKCQYRTTKCQKQAVTV